MEQGPQFLRVRAQHGHVVVHSLDALQHHAPADAPLESGVFVKGEIDARTLLEQEKNLAQGIDGFGKLLFGHFGPGPGGPHEGMAGDASQLLGQRTRRHHRVHATGVDGAARHVEVFCRGLVFGKGDARFGLDGQQADGAVRTGAREHHADGPTSLLLGQRLEEMIDGHVQPLRFRPANQVEFFLCDNHVKVGRQNIDAVGFDRHVVLDLVHWHGCGARHQFGQLALVAWIQMKDHDERHPGVHRKMFQQIHHGFEAAGGSSHSHDGEGQPFVGRRVRSKVVSRSCSRGFANRVQRLDGGGVLARRQSRAGLSGAFAG